MWMSEGLQRDIGPVYWNLLIIYQKPEVLQANWEIKGTSLAQWSTLVHVSVCQGGNEWKQRVAGSPPVGLR